MPHNTDPLPFGDRLAAAVDAIGAPIAVGIDPHLPQLPAPLRARFEGLRGQEHRIAAADAVSDWGRAVVRAVVGRCAAVKVQSAFFEQLGWPGLRALEAVVAEAKSLGLLVILDAKRGDIDTTAAAYATAALDPAGPVGADAVTVSPWMGLDTLAPFTERCAAHGAGLFVLARTSNPGSAFFQAEGGAAARLAAAIEGLAVGPLQGARLHSLGLVVGAQIPVAEVRALREAAPGAWFLVPGVGAQGGSFASSQVGARPDGSGCLAAVSRAVLFPAKGAGDDGEAYGAATAARAEALLQAARAELRGSRPL